MRPSRPARLVMYTFVVLIAVSCLLPLAWMVIAGFKGKNEILRTPFQFFPEIWRTENYARILADPAFMQALVVTFVGAAIFTLASLTVNAMAAYAFARLEFRGKRFFWVFCILPMFIPSMAILLTSFMVVSGLGMLDTLAVLVIPGVASSFQMFFIRQFYLSTPVGLEEAAMIDGASRWRIFLEIFLPQSLAPFVVVGVASFLAYWNAYVWPILTIQSVELTQIMQYLGNFRNERANEWGLMMASSVLAALPTIVLVLIFQRWIVNGVRISGLK